MGYCLESCCAFAPPDPLWNLLYPALYPGARRLVVTSAKQGSFALWLLAGNAKGSPAETERVREGRGHGTDYPPSSPVSHSSTNKAFSFRSKCSSFPGLASTPGVCLPLPWQAQELAQGTIQLCPQLCKDFPSKFSPITLFECSTYTHHFWSQGGTWSMTYALVKYLMFTI